MDVKELRNLEDAELVEKERQFKQELFNLRFQLATGRIENRPGSSENHPEGEGPPIRQDR
jgi:ribosomal protein L29